MKWIKSSGNTVKREAPAAGFDHMTPVPVWTTHEWCVPMFSAAEGETVDCLVSPHSVSFPTADGADFSGAPCSAWWDADAAGVTNTDPADGTLPLGSYEGPDDQYPERSVVRLYGPERSRAEFEAMALADDPVSGDLLVSDSNGQAACSGIQVDTLLTAIEAVEDNVATFDGAGKPQDSGASLSSLQNVLLSPVTFDVADVAEATGDDIYWGFDEHGPYLCADGSAGLLFAEGNEDLVWLKDYATGISPVYVKKADGTLWHAHTIWTKDVMVPTAQGRSVRIAYASGAGGAAYAPLTAIVGGGMVVTLQAVMGANRTFETATNHTSQFGIAV